jgi:hypothetical protein
MVFKLFEALTRENISGELIFLKHFDKIRKYISNTEKICVLISKIMKNCR